MISVDLLREWLPLPASTEILGSLENIGDNRIELLLRDAAFPILENEALPIVTPVLRKNMPVEFVNWEFEAPPSK